MKRKGCVASCAIFIWLAFVVFVEPAFSQEPRRLRYGTSNNALHLPVWVAKEGRLFAKHSLSNVEVIFFQGGTLITMGILSGDLQFSGVGASSVVPARIKGADIVLLACPADTDIVYLVSRPGIKSVAELKGKNTGVTRLGSSTHFYLRLALKYAGLNPERDVVILQLGQQFVGALEQGAVEAAALPFAQALPYLQKGYPILLDLTKTDLAYPASCVASSRSFIKENPGVVERFLRAYVEAIHLIKKDRAFAERVFEKWLRLTDPEFARKNVEAYAELFKPVPRVPDKGIEAVLEELSLKDPVPKKFFGRPDYFRDNQPLEKLVTEGWIERLYGRNF